MLKKDNNGVYDHHEIPTQKEIKIIFFQLSFYSYLKIECRLMEIRFLSLLRTLNRRNNPIKNNVNCLRKINKIMKIMQNAHK